MAIFYCLHVSFDESLYSVQRLLHIAYLFDNRFVSVVVFRPFDRSVQPVLYHFDSRFRTVSITQHTAQTVMLSSYLLVVQVGIVGHIYITIYENPCKGIGKLSVEL